MGRMGGEFSRFDQQIGLPQFSTVILWNGRGRSSGRRVRLEQRQLGIDGEYGRHLLVRVDATGYGASDDIQQAEIQQTLATLLDDAAVQAGLDRSTWRTQPAGDGELAVVPADVSEVRVVDHFVRAVSHLLAGINRRSARGDGLQLRLAIHYGVVSVGRLGFPGQGAVEVSRMVDGEPVRRALRATGADLALVLSEVIFRDAVAQPHTSLRPEQFREVRIDNKEFHRDVWLHLPGLDVHAVDLRPEKAPEPVRRNKFGEDVSGPAPRNTTDFHAPVSAHTINFGINYEVGS